MSAKLATEKGGKMGRSLRSGGENQRRKIGRKPLNNIENVEKLVEGRKMAEDGIKIKPGEKNERSKTVSLV
jgi:hypothetical protein